MQRDTEMRYHESLFSKQFIARSIQILLAAFFFELKIPTPFFKPRQYADSLRTHSDYRKFDDALRMILDCTTAQVEEIRSYLDGLYQQGEIFYGLHESDTSLMTCYVNDLSEGNHIHFIDGGNGGYAMAAKQLKRQIKEA